MVQLPDSGGVDVPVRISGKRMLNHNVMLVDLSSELLFTCEPGQFITLINSEGTARSYSVANNPTIEGHIELHVRLIANGMMSQFLTKAEVGSAMIVRGPAGNCFYVGGDDQDYPIVLAGTGTGLAPLYGIVREALAKGHKGPIQLFHGALRDADLYLVEELQALEHMHKGFRYIPCVLGGEAGRFYQCGHIEEIVTASVTGDKSVFRLFLCGAPDFVKSLRKKAFLAGIRSSHIFADAFLPSAPLKTAA